MAKMHFLQAACAAVMFAAMPAFAQSNSPPADTGAAGKLNNPMAMPDGGQPNTTSHGTMGANDMKGSMDHGSSQHAAMHAMQMPHNVNMSENAAVDKLNDESYQAARSGQAFNASAPGDMSMPGGSGHMDNASGGRSK